MVIRESSDFDETSLDDELSDWDGGGDIPNRKIKHMINSVDRVDRNLINSYRLR